MEESKPLQKPREWICVGVKLLFCYKMSNKEGNEYTEALAKCRDGIMLQLDQLEQFFANKQKEGITIPDVYLGMDLISFES